MPDGRDILDGEYDDDLYYSYRCVTCGETWNERRHAGRRFEHCPAHRVGRQRARQAPYHYTCRRCTGPFEQVAGGRHWKYCAACSAPVRTELRRRDSHEEGRRPYVPCAAWVNCRVCAQRAKQMPLPHTGAKERFAV